MSARTITHTQYDALRKYQDGKPHYMFCSPSKSLTMNGYLAREPGSGQDRASSAYRITDDGLSALAAYRARWGILAEPSP